MDFLRDGGFEDDLVLDCLLVLGEELHYGFLDPKLIIGMVGFPDKFTELPSRLSSWLEVNQMLPKRLCLSIGVRSILILFFSLLDNCLVPVILSHWSDSFTVRVWAPCCGWRVWCFGV